MIVPREVPDLPAPKLSPLPIGDASTLRKGSFLVALGNPFNAARDGKPSASWGILANIARKMYPSSDEVQRMDFQLKNYPTLLQLDAKLNLGMSGGAVINMKGELVGITTAAANAAGFDAQAGYAIPMDLLGRKVVGALIEGREYEYGFLGIGLDQRNTSRVDSAKPGTPAAQGGVLVDDLIVAVGDIPVTDRDSLVVAINSIPAGEPVTLKIERRDQLIERTVRLAKLKIRTPVIATNRPAPWRGVRVDFTSVLANAVAGPDMDKAMTQEGVLVTEVETGSEADKAGLRREPDHHPRGRYARAPARRVREGRRRAERPRHARHRDRPDYRESARRLTRRERVEANNEERRRKNPEARIKKEDSRSLESLGFELFIDLFSPFLLLLCFPSPEIATLPDPRNPARP